MSPGDRADQTRLRHTFVHGPGETMVRIMVHDDPSALERRLAELRQNMAVSLAAMLDGEHYRQTVRIEP